MPRFQSFEGAVRWDIEREQRRNRARLRTAAAVFSLLAFVCITAITTVNLQKLRESEEDEATRGGGDPLGMPGTTAGRGGTHSRGVSDWLHGNIPAVIGCQIGLVTWTSLAVINRTVFRLYKMTT
jgi:hypothetical protein